MPHKSRGPNSISSIKEFPLRASDNKEVVRDAYSEALFDAWLIYNDKFTSDLGEQINAYWTTTVDVKRKRRLRAVDRENREAMLQAFLANLAFVSRMGFDPPAFGISLRASKQKTSRYERDGFRGLPTLIESLPQTPSLFKLRRSRTKGIASSIEASQHFVEQLRQSGPYSGSFWRAPGEETIILSRVDRDFYDNESRELIEYSDTPQTQFFRAEMRALNVFMNNVEARLDQNGVLPPPAVATTLRRYFNLPPDVSEGEERFDLGGRLFGGWWLNIAKERRRKLRINGEPVADLDFSSMFLRLAYIEAGLRPPEGDLYANIQGLSDPRWRPGIKKVISAMLFRRSPLTRAPRGTRDELPRGMSGSQLRSAVLAAHPSLTSMFETGIGLRLMFIESQILIAVLLALAGKGISALPLHDAVIVPRSKADKAARIMGNVSEAVTGYRLPIALKSLY